MVKITRQTAGKLKKLLDTDATRRDRTPPGAGGSGYVSSSDDDPRIVIVVDADIAPNTWGKFKFTEGAKGAEAPIGEAFDGFYRNEEEDPPDLPEGTKCLLLWIASDEPDEPGWELFPLICLG
ncbi:MAG: hypothetical protein E6Q97_34140 [Desulfurellales bacterium]|nr:MAG: hypothetical protein E6Q97_34140 [Desulfurellales bacterium]